MICLKTHPSSREPARSLGHEINYLPWSHLTLALSGTFSSSSVPLSFSRVKPISTRPHRRRVVFTGVHWTVATESCRFVASRALLDRHIGAPNDPTYYTPVFSLTSSIHQFVQYITHTYIHTYIPVHTSSYGECIDPRKHKISLGAQMGANTIAPSQHFYRFYISLFFDASSSYDARITSSFRKIDSFFCAVQFM